MIGNWQSKNKPPHERFVELAESYRQAAMDFCHRMIEYREQQTWPNGCVVLLLAAHSVELFLKGAILSREPEASFPPNHRLDQLGEWYARLFPEPELQIDLPFQSDYSNIPEAEVDALRAAQPIPSILFRYPIQRDGTEWPGLQAFEAESFFEILDSLGSDFERVGGRL